MLELSILGVTHVSDLYPNVKYKIVLLKTLDEVKTRALVWDLGEGGLYQRFGKSSLWRRLASAGRIAWGTASVFLRFLCRRTTHVYVVYPAPVLVILLGLLPKGRRPRIFMDAFISLYDTAVNDRGMLGSKSWRARLLYWLERKAFAIADVVLVDTDENAAFYVELFGLAPSRFVALPLAIPPLECVENSLQPEQGEFTCLFMGSMVPLQGIGTVLAAIKLLDGERGLKFVIIGDGQQGYLIQEFLQEQGVGNLVWHRGMLSTEQVTRAINGVSLCLGIFGSTEKADRVFPYKLYYYAAMGKPFVTRDSTCLRRVTEGAEAELLCANDAQALASRIKLLCSNRAALAQCASASARLYQEKLSRAVVQRHLLALLAGCAVDN